jgi:tripeptide aminopeptidase
LIQQNGRTGTSNVGVIHGGAATNVVCDHVRVHAEARSHDKEFRAEIVRQIEDAFRTAASQIQSQDGQSARVEIQGRLDYEAFCLPVDHPAVIAARAAVERQAGTAELAVANGGLDANWLTERGIPTVTLGCGQTGQHTVGETLDLDEFHKACAVAWDLATEA